MQGSGGFSQHMEMDLMGFCQLTAASLIPGDFELPSSFPEK